MNNKGFTIIEIISMTIVVSVMTLVSTPLVSKELKKVKKEETIDACYLVKQGLKAYYYQNDTNSKTTLDLTNEIIKKELNIDKININFGKATINENGQITSEMIIDDFNCIISGDTEEISCS